MYVYFTLTVPKYDKQMLLAVDLGPLFAMQGDINIKSGPNKD